MKLDSVLQYSTTPPQFYPLVLSLLEENGNEDSLHSPELLSLNKNDLGLKLNLLCIRPFRHSDEVHKPLPRIMFLYAQNMTHSIKRELFILKFYYYNKNLV